MLVQYTWDQVKNAGLTLRLPAGASLGIRLKEEVHASYEPVIARDRVRAEASAAIERFGKKACWVQTGGIVQLGIGAEGSIPLGSSPLTAGGGFSANVLGTYAVMRPFAVPASEDARTLGATVKALAETHATPFPFSWEAAARMPQGEEFQFTGQFELEGSASLGIGATIGVGTSELGAEARAEVVAGGRVARTVSVKAVDGKNLVRIAIWDNDEATLGLLARLNLGLVSRPPLEATPGQGWLVGLERDAASSTVEGILSSVLGVEASAGITESVAHDRNQGFILDLSKPEARGVYRELLRGSTRRALELAERPENGVEHSRLTARDLMNTRTASIRAFGETLLLKEATSSSITGEFIDVAGRKYDAMELDFQKDFSSLLGGRKEVTFRAVTLTPKDGAPPSSYYDIRYDGWKRRGTDQMMHEFAGFGRALGIVSANQLHLHLPRLGRLRAAITREAEIDFNVEVYFTPTGTRRLRDIDPARAAKTYLDTLRFFDPAMEAHPALAARTSPRTQELLEAGVVEVSRSWLGPLVHPRRLHVLSAEYAGFTGRSLHDDAVALRDGRRFAAAVERVRSIDPGAIAGGFNARRAEHEALAAAAQHDPRLREHPALSERPDPRVEYLLRERVKHLDRPQLRRMADWSTQRRAAREYATLTAGRSLDQDATALHAAHAHGMSASAARLAEAQEQAEARTLMMTLGRAEGFHFMRPMAALARLVGIENVIADLNVRGPAVPDFDASRGQMPNADLGDAAPQVESPLPA